MPFDAIDEDLFSNYLYVCWPYEQAVIKLVVLHNEGDHGSFARTVLVTRELAAEVKKAREQAEVHRSAS